MMKEFEHDEYMFLAMYQKEGRKQTIGAIHNVLPLVAGDSEMLALAVSTLEKLEGISDVEFDSLNLEPYKTEPLEGR